MEKRKVFLLSYNPAALNRDEVTDGLSRIPFVLNWITLLPGQVFFVAQTSLRAVALALRRQFAEQLLFITEVSPELSDGWLPVDLWQFISKAPVTDVGRFPNMLAERETTEHVG